MLPLGLDIGSQSTKGVILEDGRVLASVVIPSDDEAEISAKKVIEEISSHLGANGDFYIVSTGMGGKGVTSARQQKAITTCLARGVHFLFPTARMAIDMGMESSTVVKVSEMGRLLDWANHDKCASGTGIFLQQMAKLMQVSLEEMSDLSLQAKSRAEISSTCAIFAESEVISHVHRVPPTPRDEIVAGIYYSVVSRTVSLCKRMGIQKDIAACGGVSLNKGIIKLLEKELNLEVLIPEDPQIVGALGAAIIARDNMDGNKP